MDIRNESPPESSPEKKRHQISLAAVLLTPLVLSPAFVALYLAPGIADHHMQEFGAAIWSFAFGYSSIMTLFWSRGKNGMADERAFTRLLRLGARAGLLFGVLFGLPIETAKAVALAGRMSAVNIAGQTIGPALAIAVSSLLMGLAAGGLLGLVRSQPRASR